MIGEKIVFAAFLGSKQFWSLEIILVLKFNLILYYCCTRLYFETIQKVRSIATHIIHFLLIFLVILHEHIFRPYGVLSRMPLNLMEGFYSALLLLLLLISAAFYVREFWQYCEADMRDIDDSENTYAK